MGGESKEIYIIRHGETEWNKLGLSQGSKNDIELNDMGKKQARETGKYLKTRLKPDEHYDLIISSPLKRAIQTAEIIAEEVGNGKNKIIVNELLTEVDLGKLAIGMTDEQLRKDPFYDDFFKEMDIYFKMDHIDKKLAFTEIPEIFTKKYKLESHDHIRRRIKKFLDFLKKTDDNKIIVVSHNGTIEWINRVILNTNENIKGDLSNGKNCHLTYYLLEKNKFKLIMAPNTIHLKIKN